MTDSDGTRITTFFITGARLLDVTNEDAVLATIDGVESEHGPIDVLVVNAGYGHEGTLEETTMEDARRQFEVNVFGAIATIKAALPHMRARRAGHIFTITSMGGLRTFPAGSLYHDSKYALEGISESLAREVEHLGIHVTAVAPGGFRTGWAGRSMVRTPNTIDDYEPVLGPAREARQKGRAGSSATRSRPVRRCSPCCRTRTRRATCCLGQMRCDWSPKPSGGAGRHRPLRAAVTLDGLRRRISDGDLTGHAGPLETS